MVAHLMDLRGTSRVKKWSPVAYFANRFWTNYIVRVHVNVPTVHTAPSLYTLCALTGELCMYSV